MAVSLHFRERLDIVLLSQCAVTCPNLTGLPLKQVLPPLLYVGQDGMDGAVMDPWVAQSGAAFEWTGRQLPPHVCSLVTLLKFCLLALGSELACFGSPASDWPASYLFCEPQSFAGIQFF